MGLNPIEHVVQSLPALFAACASSLCELASKVDTRANQQSRNLGHGSEGNKVKIEQGPRSPPREEQQDARKPLVHFLTFGSPLEMHATGRFFAF